jgi:hypothetical protein
LVLEVFWPYLANLMIFGQKYIWLKLTNFEES